MSFDWSAKRAHISFPRTRTDMLECMKVFARHLPTYANKDAVWVDDMVRVHEVLCTHHAYVSESSMIIMCRKSSMICGCQQLYRRGNTPLYLIICFFDYPFIGWLIEIRYTNRSTGFLKIDGVHTMLLAKHDGRSTSLREGFDKLPLMNGSKPILILHMDVGKYGMNLVEEIQAIFTWVG